jgi:hypothetical protein
MSGDNRFTFEKECINLDVGIILNGDWHNIWRQSFYKSTQRIL